MVTDEMMKRAVEAYRKDTGAEDWQLLGWVNSAIRAALEAALSDAEPDAWVYAPDLAKGSGGFGKEKGSVLMSLDGEWINVDTPLYAAPPAPSVAVKALEWQKVALGTLDWNWLEVENASTAFGAYSLQRHNTGHLRVMFGGKVVNFFEPEKHTDARAAAQADYEARIRSALSAQVQDVAGDEEWQTVPKHPTGRMIDAVVSMVDDVAPHPFILNLYRAMLAAAPAKQEG